MFKYKTAGAIGLCVVSLLTMAAAETWHLERQGDDWEALSGNQGAKYLLAVAEIKQLVIAGQTKEVRRAMEKLKSDFPEIAGADLEAFIKADILFCEGKFAKAVRAYDGFLDKYPRSQLYQAALDRQFAIATAFLAGQKKTVLKVLRLRRYGEGVKIMEKISDRAGNAPIAVKAAQMIAKSYEKRKKFNEAHLQWSQVQSRWPTGQVGKEALLAMGRCKHAAYKGPRFSASNLISAKSYYANFKLRYPKDAEKLDIGGKLEMIEEQLAFKELTIAKYYQRSGHKQPANFYYQMVEDNWPESTAANMAREKRKSLVLDNTKK